MTSAPHNSTAAPLLTEHEAADYLSLSVRTLQKWRWQNQGPVFVKIGHQLKGAVRYREADLAAFLAAGVRHPAPPLAPSLADLTAPLADSNHGEARA